MSHMYTAGMVQAVELRREVWSRPARGPALKEMRGMPCAWVAACSNLRLQEWRGPIPPNRCDLEEISVEQPDRNLIIAPNWHLGTVPKVRRRV